MSRGQIELDRAGMIRALNDEAGRKSSTATILYQLAIADRLNLSLTDLVAGEIVSRTGAITAGELAELSGLTTGAITGVVDRLEKGGFLRRVNDPNDRRRVMLEPISQRFDKLAGDPYEALEKRFNDLYAEYSDAELALLLEFLRKSITIFDEEGVRLRTKDAAREQTNEAPLDTHIRARMNVQAKVHADIHADADAIVQIRRGRKDKRTFSTPRGALTAARLDWNSGAVHLNLRGAHELPELYRAEFKHDIPIVRDNEGKVSVQYRHRTLFGRGGGEAIVTLNAAAAWDMNFEIGASHVQADLREILLRSFTLKSKAGKFELRLPPPRGTVLIRLESGVSHIRIERPKGVPVHLEFEGDWSTLRFDRQRGNVMNESRESSDYKRATDRYRIEFIGGASKLTVEESK